ncbi:MAG: hypothetical protein Q9161_007082 [Pseudevernia consocians]
MLDAPHSMMNKFGGPNDANFGLVSNVIKRMVEEAKRIAISQREDNADDTNLDLAQFLPAGKNGSILITTRLPECANHQTVGKDIYERLDQETATTLLLKACGIDLSLREVDGDNASTVAELLGCHALAVIQAGAAIRHGICGLAEYKDFFQNERQTLLEYFPSQGKSTYGGVYATFEVSAAYLEARNDQVAKDAIQLLRFYAFMHFEDFPEAAFEEAWKNSKDADVVSSALLSDGREDIGALAPWHVFHLPTFMRQSPYNINLSKICLRQARSLLTSLSLVAFDSAKETTRMHPVSHFWSRDRLRKPEESMNAGLNGLSLLSLSIKDPWARDVNPLSSQLKPHIEFIAHSMKEWDFLQCSFHCQQSACRLSWAMYHLDCESGLFALLQMIPIQRDESWIKTEYGLNIQLLHGVYLYEYGDAKEAVNLLEMINEAWMHTLAADDRRLLVVQDQLARAYHMVNDMNKAIDLLESMVEIGTRTLGPEHRETVKAIALLKAVVKIRTRTLSPEHRDLLASQHELATAYLETGETVKAIDLLKSVVKIKTRTLSPEHRDLLTSQHELARAYRKIGETVKAIDLLESVTEMRTRTLGPEHRDLLRSQHGLARAYLEIGETVKAIDLLEPVVEIKERTLRADDPSRVRSIYVLAQCYRRARNYKRALQLARSIENVAQNRPGEKLADWNSKLIGLILKKMDLEKTTRSRRAGR